MLIIKVIIILILAITSAIFWRIVLIGLEELFKIVPLQIISVLFIALVIIIWMVGFIERKKG